ncbi:MAG TPA: branched-chain amino acid ABC transporter substrate-binding protein [bacterium]
MKRAWLGVVLTAALAVALVACGSKSDNIKIGIAGPMTGSEAKFGEQLKKGAEMAVADINAAGGINGKKLELVPGDDACDPKQAQSVATKLVGEKVSAVIGHFCSSSTIPASVVYSEANIIQITPASTNPQVTERKIATVFRTCGRDDQQGDVAGDFIAKLKPKAVAIIHDKTTYGQGLADATKSRLNGKYKIKETLYEGINKGDKDFSSLITKMKGAKIDAIFFGGYHTEAGLMVRQAYDLGLKAKFVSGDALVTDEFATVVGKNQATAGVVMTFGADARKNPSAKAVVDKFKADKYDPEGYTLYSYAAVQSVAAAMKANNNSKDGKVLAAWLKANAVETVMGAKSWDEKGDLKVSDYVVYGWKEKDGKMTYDEL